MPTILSKKAIIVHYQGKPIAIFHVQDCNSHDFLVLEKECKQNLYELLDSFETEKVALLERVENLEKEIKILKGED